MKRSVLLSLLLLFVQPLAGEERLAAIHPGDSCAAIPGIERRLGSVELKAVDAGVGGEYLGEQGGREARIVYRCEAGRLIEQTVIVITSSHEEARRFAQAQQVELVRHLGEPIHDGFRLPTWRVLLYGFLGGDLDFLTNVVVWGRADEDFMLSVIEIGANQWQVSISQGSSKLEYIINS